VLLDYFVVEFFHSYAYELIAESQQHALAVVSSSNGLKNNIVSLCLEVDGPWPGFVSGEAHPTALQLNVRQ
jgi:hypothetical protein